MSVEQRLRLAYRDEDTAATSLGSTYRAVVDGSRRRSRQRASATIAAIGMAALATVVALQSTARQPESLEPAPPPHSVITPSGRELLAGGLEGTWRSQPMSRQLVVQMLRDEGYATYATDYASTHLPRGTFRIHLRIDENEISVRVGNRRARAGDIVKVEVDQIEIRPRDGRAGTTTYGWRLDGGALFLRFESSNWTPSSGDFPAGVYAVATYNLAIFSRLG
jgi:hypothetical protein